GRSEMPVTLSTGDTVKGSVVSVDTESGTAVLAVPIEIANPQIAPTAKDEPKQGTLMGSTATMWSDGDGTQVSYDPSSVQPDEGALVLDDDGDLIGMCTKTSKGVRLVGVKNLLKAVNMATVKEASAWAGIVVHLDNSTVSVQSVLPDGPALAAGAQSGDIVK